MEHELFDGADTQCELEEKGYVVRPFLDTEELEALARMLPIPASLPFDFWATSLSLDVDYRREVLDVIKALTRAALERLVPGYQLCLGAIVAKRRHGMQGVPLHQDWWLADNSTHRALHFWCPLSDVDSDNGCLRMVPGSHRFVHHPCPLFPPDYRMSFKPVLASLEAEFTVPVPTPAGAAVIYDERLLHGSGLNRSAHPRIAINCGVIPAQLSPRVYHVDPDDPTRMDVLEVDADFLCRFPYGGCVTRPYPASVTWLESIAVEASSLGADELGELRQSQARLRAMYGA